MPRRGRQNLGSEVASREAMIKEWPCGRHKLLFWTKATTMYLGHHTWCWVLCRYQQGQAVSQLRIFGQRRVQLSWVLRSTGWGLGRWASGHLGTP